MGYSLSNYDALENVLDILKGVFFIITEIERQIIYKTVDAYALIV